MTLGERRNFNHRAQATRNGARLTALARQVAVSAPPESPSVFPPPRDSVEQPRRLRRTGAGRFFSGVATLFVACALCVLGWRIVVDTIADHRAGEAAAGETMALSSSAAMLDRSALHQITMANGAGDLAAARHSAEQALRSDPLDTRAIALLAMIADRRGDRDRADELMNIAAGRTFHDPMIETWMLLRNLQLRDFDAALSHVDVLLRTHPEFEPVTLRMFAEMTGHPSARRAMTDVLATAPTWRLELLTELCDRIAEPDRLIALYSGLYKSPHPPTADELRPYLNRLVASGRYQDAHRDWALMAPPNARRDLDLRPYDGDFSAEPSGMPFDWRLDSVPGARIDIVPSPGGSGRALRVQFSGARIGFKNVSQLLLLAPGVYHLSGLTRASDLQTSRGLWWRIQCAEQPNATLARTDLISGSLPWTSFGVDFRVPDKGCQAQWLKLELPARTATEHQIAGEVWYRNLRISVETAKAAPPRLSNNAVSEAALESK